MARLQGWPVFEQLQSNLLFSTGNLTIHNLQWPPQKKGGFQFYQWEEEWKMTEAFKNADLIISDNLVGVLQSRPDAILMGSFLWKDVYAHAYPDNPEVQQFVARETQLLQQTRPPMLCVGDIAMPGVLQETEAVPLPWFGWEAPCRTRKIQRLQTIAIQAGATDAAADRADQLALALARQNTYTIALPKSGIDRLHLRDHPHVIPFDFSSEAYRSCDLVVCRPGVGTITDCITAGTPMAFFYEPDNIEMSWNASRLAQKGIAQNWGVSPAPEAMLEALQAPGFEAQLREMAERIKTIPTDGYDKSVEWLAGRYPHLFAL